MTLSLLFVFLSLIVMHVKLKEHLNLGHDYSIFVHVLGNLCLTSASTCTHYFPFSLALQTISLNFALPISPLHTKSFDSVSK